MTRISWDEPHDRFFSAGVDRAIFYPNSAPGVPWNGIVSITDTTQGAETAITYVDGLAYKHESFQGDFQAEIAAFTYPQEFEEYDGAEGILKHQDSRVFGLSYRTTHLSGQDSDIHHYQIHLIYNAEAVAHEMEYSSLSDTLDLEPFVWTIHTVPTKVPYSQSSSHLIIDTRYAYSNVVATVEDILYGTETEAPRLPSPIELEAIFQNAAQLKVTDHGDGTFTVEGPDDAVKMLNSDIFQIDWPSVVMLDDHTYNVSSL